MKEMPKQNTEQKALHGAFEAIIKIFGPSTFVIYFFTLGYLKNLKIAVAPSITDALAFFISSVIPGMASTFLNLDSRYLVTALIPWIPRLLALILIFQLPSALGTLAMSRKRTLENRKAMLDRARFAKRALRLIRHLLGIWIPGLVMALCLSALEFTQSKQIVLELPGGQLVPASRLTYMLAILMAMAWGPYSLYVTARASRYWFKMINLVTSFLCMCGLSYYLAFAHSGNFTSAGRVRIAGDESSDNRIVWTNGTITFFVSCPAHGEWTVARYDGKTEIYRNNLSRDKHSGICRQDI